jgi:hypothetical protein
MADSYMTTPVLWLKEDAVITVSQVPTYNAVNIRNADELILSIMTHPTLTLGLVRLRDALNEILEGVPTPPEDEVIGLTHDTPEEERHPDDNYTR